MSSAENVYVPAYWSFLVLVFSTTEYCPTCGFFATFVNGLALSGISPFWQLAVQGFLILLAVVADSSIQQRIKRTMLRSIDRRSVDRRGAVK